MFSNVISYSVFLCVHISIVRKLRLSGCRRQYANMHTLSTVCMYYNVTNSSSRIPPTPHDDNDDDDDIVTHPKIQHNRLAPPQRAVTTSPQPLPSTTVTTATTIAATMLLSNHMQAASARQRTCENTHHLHDAHIVLCYYDTTFFYGMHRIGRIFDVSVGVGV